MNLLINLQSVYSQENEGGTIKNYWNINTDLYECSIIQSSPNVPTNKNPFVIEFNPSIQTNGSKDWHQLLGFPATGCSLFYGNLGNQEVLGQFFGIVPNMTFNNTNPKWYAVRTSIGLGLAWFDKPYNETTNPGNIFIGTHITAYVNGKVFIKVNLWDHLSLTTGLMISHCSDGHYQMPNVGLNMFSFYVGLSYSPLKNIYYLEKRTIDIPKGRIKINFRTGVGVHVLDLTVGQINNVRYAVYSNDIYLSKRYGAANNLHAGIEINQYNSYYNYIVNNGFFTNLQKLKSTVFAIYLAHELMIDRLGILTQIGINLYNPFYDNYINLYKSETPGEKVLKDLIPVKLGLQYYLFNPKYCTVNNIYIGAYIKANYAQADFICSQIGFVF